MTVTNGSMKEVWFSFQNWSCKDIVFVILCISTCVANYVFGVAYSLPNKKRSITNKPFTYAASHMHTAEILNNKTAFKEETVVTRDILIQKEGAVNETLIEYYRKKLQTFGFTMKSFLLPYKIKAPGLHRRVDKFYNTCAVVGSSGILNGSQCGEEISSHEFIIRLNMATIDGFQKDVGNRTDLMSINYPISHALDKCLRNTKCRDSAYRRLKPIKNSILLFHEFHDPNPNWKLQGHKQFIQSLKRYNLLPDIRVSAKNATLRLKSAWNITKQPSGGLRGITAALLMCRSISMYGYYPFSEGTNGEPLQYHYFDNGFWNKKIHNMSEEYSIFKKLDKIGRIRLVTNKCKKDLI
ncbi:CMP-N-acetylneuraminate-poly-alpha-2,8-sialyltransferase-like [Anneissia japonica]|uniref:CMP-N-acetylneuraminate-poly-alpha-2, 8-sialyltransferase-like n=1 Tax=Anneissia japonica TaxID=1529436 RepID=UPI001425505C|nr:CMP-N-acetylneuraminate-poly-alpha-2,8-sialyltransferase-like [Anneissia japonica]